MALTPYLNDQIAEGQVVLFLGAGAAYGATSPTGERPLSGNALRDRISDKFLGGELKDKSLSRVAELAKSESSLFDVQRYLYELFSPLQPADFHQLISQFRWYGIVTTNYDFILERAYESCTSRLQDYRVITHDGDPYWDEASDPKIVPVLKIHGSLSSINDENLPLILASEEYAKHKANRLRLFQHFQDWASNHPVVFCGYDLSDPNIDQILFDIGDGSLKRPSFALVNPALTEYDERYWSSRRVFPYKFKFEDFLSELDAEIPHIRRQLAALKSTSALSIQRWVTSGTPSDALKVYLSSELEHVHEGITTGGATASDFYRGNATIWSAIKQEFDIQRGLTDDILVDAVLESSRALVPELYVLKGYAGSGKTISLLRVAWEAGTAHDRFCFWIHEGGNIRVNAIAELFHLTGERLFLFVDDLIAHLVEVVNLVDFAQTQSIPITIIGSARTNEWNVAGDELDQRLTAEYELRDLSSREIAELVKKLKKFKQLSAPLLALEPSEMSDFFRLTADRQLLVALHEATAGKTFEEIIIDEYEKLVPLESKIVYQDVCTLHRFNVGLRAGLMSRISGVSFEYFRETLLAPLEHVVHVYSDSLSRDFAYRTRHPIIADLVFRRVLDDQEKRASQLVRVISRMNVDYRSDQIAFEQLIKGRELANLFSDRIFADRVFEAALRSSAPIEHIEHQRAVFELNHNAGSLLNALRAIERAEASVLAANGHISDAIKHTKAVVFGRLASETTVRLEKERYREAAKEILQRQIRKARTPHSFSALARILTDELLERLETSDSSESGGLQDTIVIRLVGDLEKILTEGLQQFSEDSFLLGAQAQLAQILDDTPRAVAALRRANLANPGNGPLAVRVSKQYTSTGQHSEGRAILMACLEVNPVSREAHLELALSLMNENEQSYKAEISRHLRSAFVDGDSNYRAQFWFARHEFLFGQKSNAAKYFNALRKARLPPLVRNKVQGKILDQGGVPKLFEGSIKTKKDSYCFVGMPEHNTDVFVHYSSFADDDWHKLIIGEPIFYEVGFTFKGIQGVSAKKRNSS